LQNPLHLCSTGQATRFRIDHEWLLTTQTVARPGATGIEAKHIANPFITRFVRMAGKPLQRFQNLVTVANPCLSLQRPNHCSVVIMTFFIRANKGRISPL
jgi:hypothetical protein